MTNPTPPPPGLLPPLNPDGTPVLGTTAAPQTSRPSIWNIPDGLPSDKRVIWFSIGHRHVNELADSGLGPHQTADQTVTTDSHMRNRSPEEIYRMYSALSLSPDPADHQKFLDLQYQLAVGNFGSVQPTGRFDVATQKALGAAMLEWFQNTHGTHTPMPFEDYLLRSTQYGTQSGVGPAGGGGSAPKDTSISVSDPQAIRAAAQSAAQDALGQALSPDQLSQFVAQFQSAQSSAQTATSGQVNVPDLSSDAMQFAQQSDPHAYQQQKRQSYLNALVNLLGPPVNRPSMTPVPAA